MATLTRVYTQTAAGNTTALAKRKMEDVNKRLGQLFERLNQNDISAQACDKLLHLCGGAFALSSSVLNCPDLTSPGLAALDANDFGKAGEMQVALTSEDWEENSTWIIAIKRLMDTAKGVAR